MPSKRPQTITAPSPWASAAARACVSGAPRALISRRGRLSAATASMARASTSAFITMPGPPPAGVSSTVPCRSVACARMSCASSDQTPAASALPARLSPSGPGNISGNSVRMVARHIVRHSVGAERHDDHAARGDVDLRHRGVGERHHQRLAAALRLDLHEIAGAEIEDRRHGAERRAVRRHRRPGRPGRRDRTSRRPRSAAACRARRRA